MIGGGALVRVGSTAVGIAILIGLVYLVATYPQWVAQRIDGDWRTPGGAVFTFRSGKVKTQVAGKETMAAGHFAYRAGKTWDDALLIKREATRFSATGGMRFWLFPDGGLQMRVRYGEGAEAPREVRLNAKPAGEGKMELSETTGPSGSRILLSKPLVVTRVK